MSGIGRRGLALMVVLACAACAGSAPTGSRSFDGIDASAAREFPESGPFVDGRRGPSGGTIFDPVSAPLEAAVPYRFSLGHCGLSSPVDADGSFWDAIGGVTAAGQPLALDASDEMFNATGGVIVVIGDEARFRTDAGTIVRFSRHTGDKAFSGCD